MSDNEHLDQRVLELADLGISMASILHEIRQPLFAMRGMAQLGLVNHKDHVQTLQSILRQLEHLEEMIGFYTDDLGAEPRLFDPDIAVERAVVMVARRFEKENINFGWVREGEQGQVTGRARALCQVMVNLLNNAAQAAASVQNPTIELLTRCSDTHSVIELTDNGGGVAKELRQTLFEPFVTSRPNSGGTGLGLYIAAELIASLGGTVSVDNLDRGARFTIELPLS